MLSMLVVSWPIEQSALDTQVGTFSSCRHIVRWSLILFVALPASATEPFVPITGTKPIPTLSLSVNVIVDAAFL